MIRLPILPRSASARTAILPLMLMCATALVPVSALAQPAPEDRERPERRERRGGENREDITTVVVTAAASKVDVRDAPASVSVITREEIDRQPVRSVGELLGRLPGVTGGLAPSGALSKVTIRGLPDNYTLILVDGRRVGNSDSISYRPDLARQGLNWISPDLIERIEVVRGPMSSLYGSDALGGVINIVTRRIPPVWRGSANASYTLPEDSNRGEAYAFGINAAGPLNDKLALRIGANYNRTDPDEVVIGDGRTENAGASGIVTKTVNGLLTFRPAEAHIFTLEAGYGLEDPLIPTTLTQDQPPPWGSGGLVAQSAFGSKTSRVNLRVGHEGNWSFGESRIDLYHNAYENKDQADASGTSEFEETILEGLVNFSLNLGWEHKLAVGGQFRKEELTNTQTLGTVPTDPLGNPVSGATLSGDTAAVFVEDQVTLREHLLLTLGARLDSHDRYGEHVSPRAYLVWHPDRHWTLRGGVSKGFRAPSLQESSAGAATQSRGGGCSSLVGLGYTSGGCWMTGNPDLKPEESVNYEIGASFANRGRRFGVTWFYTDFENKIEYAALGGPPQGYDRWWTQRVNLQKARTKGLELTGQTWLTRTLAVRANATWMIEAKNLDTGGALITTPEWSAYGALDWRPSERLSFVASAQYTGEQLGAADTITDSYTTVDLTAGFEASRTVTLRAGVQNLFDKEITGDSGFGYYSPGRRLFVGVTSRF